VSVFALITVSFGPVGGSCFCAAGCQGFSAHGLAIFLLSIGAGRKVVLNESVGSGGHGGFWNTVGSVSAVADHLRLSKGWSSAFFAGLSIAAITYREFLSKTSLSVGFLASTGIGAVADGEVIGDESSCSAVNSWLAIAAIADWELLDKSFLAIWFLASAGVEAIADGEINWSRWISRGILSEGGGFAVLVGSSVVSIANWVDFIHHKGSRTSGSAISSGNTV